MSEPQTSRYGLIKDTGSAHWYGRDGSPQHSTNVRGARRHGHYPSVTSYLRVWPKDALDRWKIEQAIMAAITLPRKKGETDDDFAKRVVVDMGEEAKSAAEKGTILHDIMNIRLITGKFPREKYPDYVEWMEVYDGWIASHIQKTIMSEEVLVNDQWGYAGTVDLIAETRMWGTAVLDFKNQNVRERGPAFYDEWLFQLVAYAHAWDEDLFTKDSPVDSLVTLVLDRNKPTAPYVHVWPREQWELAWEKFKAAMQLWCLHKEYDPISWTPPPPRKTASRKSKPKQTALPGIA